MLAYRKTDFDQYLLSRESKGNQAKPSPFFSPNLFARIGLFLFGNLGASSAFGLFSLMFLSSGERNLGVLLIIFGVGLGFFLEAMLRRNKPFFRAGLEEAALYGALGCLIAGTLWTFDWYKPIPTGIQVLIVVLFAAAAIRYADSLLAVLAYALSFYVVFDQAASWGIGARFVLPIVTIAISSGMIWATGQALEKTAWKYWRHLSLALRCAAILTCYAGGNYFVVREFSQSMFHVSLEPGETIPLAWLFYAFTFAYPVYCIAWGLKRHDRLFLQVGLALVGFAVFTYKYYHHTIPLEVGMVLGGVVLLAVAIVALKVFRNARFGITSQSHAGSLSHGMKNLEGLAALAQVSGPGVTAQPSGGENHPGNGLQGEGGKFGGGGASGGF